MFRGLPMRSIWKIFPSFPPVKKEDPFTLHTLGIPFAYLGAVAYTKDE
jgi:hypothetical protein